MVNSRNQGFTLIELVVVIVILGILAATALPKFVNLQADAGAATAAGVAGALASATAINYGAKAAGNSSVTPAALTGAAPTICTAANLGPLLSGGWPSGFSALGGAFTCVAGDTIPCTITHTSTGQTATATLTCY